MWMPSLCCQHHSCGKAYQGKLQIRWWCARYQAGNPHNKMVVFHNKTLATGVSYQDTCLHHGWLCVTCSPEAVLWLITLLLCHWLLLMLTSDTRSHVYGSVCHQCCNEQWTQDEGKVKESSDIGISLVYDVSDETTVLGMSSKKIIAQKVTLEHSHLPLPPLLSLNGTREIGI